MKTPVPPELLVHIGDMTVSFALLELQLQIVFGVLANQSAKNAQLLASYLSFSNLRAAIISLYKEHFGEDESFLELKGLVAKAGKLEEERNRITHSIWASGHTATSITRIKVTAREKRGLNVEHKQYEAKDLADFVAKIQQLADDVLAFYHNKLPTLPSASS